MHRKQPMREYHDTVCDETTMEECAENPGLADAKHDTTKATNRDLLVQNLAELNREARRLERQYARSLMDADDIRQHMAESILRQPEGRPWGMLLQHAIWDARDELLSPRARNSYAGRFDHVSVDKLLEEGFQMDEHGNLHRPGCITEEQ